MKVVILAGGRGTRISEESLIRPKPMIEIGGQPILWHIMKHYSYFGYHEFVVCCGYKGYMIKEYFADYYLHRSDITFDFANDNKMIVHNNVAEPWKVTLVDTGLDTQTGGRIRRVRRFLDEQPFMLTYGDGVSNIDINLLLKQHRQAQKTVTLSAIQPGGRFGILDITDGSVTGFREKPKESGGWVNAGFMVAEPEVFEYIENDDQCIFEQTPLERLGKEKKLGAYKHQGFWQCMDTQRDKIILEQLWEEHSAPWKIWQDNC